MRDPYAPPPGRARGAEGRPPGPPQPPPGPYVPAPGGQPRPAEPALRNSSRALDLLLAAALTLIIGLPSVATAVSSSRPSAMLTGVLASFVMPAALYWRRSHPVPSAVAVYAAALVHFLAGSPLILADLLIFVALYSVTAHGPLWAGRVALAGGLLGSLLQALSLAGTSGPNVQGSSAVNWDIGQEDLAPVVFTTGLIGVVCLLAWALGLLRRSRLAHTETLAERARRLEVERDQQAQIATAAERSRIAREMHDVVAHSLSVVIAQADGGRYAASADPDAAVRALTTISETGRAALADMRKILGVLRAPGNEQHPQSTVPQPIDADLDALVAQVHDSGLEVSLVRVGQARPLPPGLGLTVYRICQEALTNVLKHGGPTASATVLLQWSSQRLTLQVDDTGRGAAATSDGAGHGILGMQERVNLFAGTLEAGARAGGGFRVRAEIPLPEAPGSVPFTGAVLPEAPAPSGSGVVAPPSPASWPHHEQNGTP